MLLTLGVTRCMKDTLTIPPMENILLLVRFYIFSILFSPLCLLEIFKNVRLIASYSFVKSNKLKVCFLINMNTVFPFKDLCQ